MYFMMFVVSENVKRVYITYGDIFNALQTAERKIAYLEIQGIELKEIKMCSLWDVGANALHFSWYQY